MAFKGPGDRTISVDTWAGAPTDVTSLVRSIEGIGEREPVVEEVTGVGATRPARRPSGFIETKPIKIVFSQDTGGAYDARSELMQHMGDNSAMITVTCTYSAGKTDSIETYIGPCKVVTNAKNETFIEVELEPTGTETAVY